MGIERIALLLMLIAAALAIASTIIIVTFRRPGWSFFDPGVSTFSLMRDPAKYVREPYARAAQILGILALMLAAGTVVGLIFRNAFR